MIDPKPFKTHTHTAYYTVEDYHTRELSLAVEVIDEFTGMLPAIPFRLKLAMQVGEKFFEIMSAVVSRSSLSQTRGPRLVRTASDYLCYLDLPEGTYQLEVEGDPVKGPWYFPAKLEAVIPLPPPPGPEPPDLSKQIILKPLPSYPYPPNATLVRGTVKYPDGNPVAKATVSLLTKPTTTFTNADGIFTLFVKTMEAATEDVELKIQGEHWPKIVAITITEGKTTKVEINDFPNL